jgi:hypothetical protein
MPVPIGEPFDNISADIVGPLPETHHGNQYLLVVTDRFTKWCEAWPLRTADAATTAKCLLEWICRFGAPKTLLTDKGANFCSKVVQQVNELWHIHTQTTTSYHPQCNGSTERTNRILEELMRSYCAEDGRDWDEIVPLALSAYRQAIHASTGETPFHIVFGRDPTLPIDLVLNTRLDDPTDDDNSAEGQQMRGWIAAQRKRIENGVRAVRRRLLAAERQRAAQYNKTHRDVSYQVGDRVWVYYPRKEVAEASQKFAWHWHGPFRIVGMRSPVVATIRFVTPRKIWDENVHVQRLRPCFVINGVWPPPRDDMPLTLEQMADTSILPAADMQAPSKEEGDGPRSSTPPKQKQSHRTNAQQMEEELARHAQRTSALKVRQRRKEQGDSQPVDPYDSNSDSEAEESAQDMRPLPAPRPETAWYKVRDIVDVRENKQTKQIEYKVLWEGCTNDNYSWLPETELRCDDSLQRFRERMANRKQIHSAAGAKQRQQAAHLATRMQSTGPVATAPRFAQQEASQQQPPAPAPSPAAVRTHSPANNLNSTVLPGTNHDDAHLPTQPSAPAQESLRERHKRKPPAFYRV